MKKRKFWEFMLLIAILLVGGIFSSSQGLAAATENKLSFGIQVVDKQLPRLKFANVKVEAQPAGYRGLTITLPGGLTSNGEKVLPVGWQYKQGGNTATVSFGDKATATNREVSAYLQKLRVSSTQGKFPEGQVKIALKEELGTVSAAASLPEPVISNYLDTEGKALKEIAPQWQLGDLQSKFRIEPKSVANYRFVKAEGPVSGVFTTQKQVVNFVYETEAAAEGKVEVNYVSSDGEVLAPSQTLTGAIGTEYTVESLGIKDYELSKTEGAVKGQYTEEPQAVTFTYQRVVPVKKFGSVKVRYLAADGKALAAEVNETGEVGTAYKFEAKTIAGYRLDKVSGVATGNYEEAAKEIIFHYVKIDTPPAPIKGKVITRFVNSQDKELVERVEISGNIGTDYRTTQKAIAGYTFQWVKGETAGKFVEGELVVSYVYLKDPRLTINYLDDKGVALQAPVLRKGKVGDKWTVEKTAIKGYSYVKATRGNQLSELSGTFGDGDDLTINLVYAKNTPVTPTPTPKPTPKPTPAPAKKTTKKTIPKMGSENQLWLQVVGMIVVVVAGIAVVSRLRKHDLK